MSSKTEVPIHVVDKRHGQNSESPRRSIPEGRRAHSVLLACYSEDGARSYLEQAELSSSLVEELMLQRAQARKHMDSLPPLDSDAASLVLDDEAALTEINRVMSRPDCLGAYPEGTWDPELVEIAKLITAHPSLDVEYAEVLGDSDFNPHDLLSQVKLCFAERHSGEFEVKVDQSQKAVNLQGINPSLEVVGLRYEQAENNGPLMVSFMIGCAPNIVVVAHYQGRYFLASGYHRVYRLMKAGVSHVPCAVREARSLAQLGAPGKPVFSEPLLMAPRPPLFTDFADEQMGVIVPLRPVQKIVRIRPDEYFAFR